jgi:hypothetical protein
MSEETIDKKVYSMKMEKVFSPAVPQIVEHKINNTPFIWAGIDNLFPQFIAELFNKSAINRTCILSKQIAVVGNGLRTVDPGQEALLEYINPNESWTEVFEKFALDYLTFGAGALNIIWSNDGTEIAEIYHIDVSTVRSGHINYDSQCVEEYYVSYDWSRYKKAEWKPRAFHKFDPSKALEHPSQILYYFDYAIGQKYYALPSYSGAMTDIATDVEISSYHLSHLKNGLTPNLVIQMNNGDPGAIEKNAIYQDITSAFSGTENASKVMVFFNSGPENKADITTIAPVGDDYYIQLNSRIEQRVLIGHQISSPKLLGIYNTEASIQIGNNKDEILTAYELFKQQIIIPNTKALLKPFNKLFKYKGGQGELYIEPIKLFDNQEGQPVDTQVVTEMS